MWIRLVIAAIVLYLLYRVGRALFRPSGRTSVPGRPNPGGEDLVEDPVCGTYVPEGSALKVSVNGRTVHFCSRDCLEKFKMEKMSSKGEP
ncbi:MAG: YHS domain protein [Syntrophaceae bacterium PtaU1.Bin231]|nr:MAG: YHS domain protein [Syntrophaceae bacterium PtaU1.Bin231]HOG16472.1 YHS domain-containing protein [Syntrophales bacterium]